MRPIQYLSLIDTLSGDGKKEKLSYNSRQRNPIKIWFDLSLDTKCARNGKKKLYNYVLRKVFFLSSDGSALKTTEKLVLFPSIALFSKQRPLNGTVNIKPSQMKRHQRAQAHNSKLYRRKHSFKYWLCSKQNCLLCAYECDFGDNDIITIV
jgi:hypothetical protein